MGFSFLLTSRVSCLTRSWQDMSLSAKDPLGRIPSDYPKKSFSQDPSHTAFLPFSRTALCRLEIVSVFKLSHFSTKHSFFFECVMVLVTCWVVFFKFSSRLFSYPASIFAFIVRFILFLLWDTRLKKIKIIKLNREKNNIIVGRYELMTRGVFLWVVGPMSSFHVRSIGQTFSYFIHSRDNKYLMSRSI